LPAPLFYELDALINRVTEKKKKKKKKQKIRHEEKKKKKKDRQRTGSHGIPP
jgi:hypothetical protein